MLMLLGLNVKNNAHLTETVELVKQAMTENGLTGEEFVHTKNDYGYRVMFVNEGKPVELESIDQGRKIADKFFELLGKEKAKDFKPVIQITKGEYTEAIAYDH